MRGTPAKTRARIRAVLDHHLVQAPYGDSISLTVFAHHVHGEPITLDQVATRPFESFPVGGAWGGQWDTTWFRFEGIIPAHWHGKSILAVIDLGYRGHPGFGAEGLVYFQGEAVQGINPKHSAVMITKSAHGGDRIELLIEAGANPPAPRTLEWPLLLPDPGGKPLFRLDRADLVVFDVDISRFGIDFKVLTELMEQLPEEGPRAAAIQAALNDACNALDLEDIAGSYEQAHKLIADLLLVPAAPTSHLVTAVGHAHIDTAWLWPLRETLRKCARTFSTVLSLMEEHDDFRFACSQAQQYEWVKNEYPRLFARIREKIRTGSWEPVGSMWVEADCNIPSGESLIRQILYGKRFFWKEFGYETKDIWLPDVFGYSAALPQIMAQTGIEFFLTQKMSWNDTNRFPHHTFYWEGIDGTRIFTHFPPADTYNASFALSEVLRGSNNFKQHELSSRSLYVFGYGDGGGGPTQEMIEIARRLGDLEGCPRVEMGRVAEFFEQARAEAGNLPVWSGELYLEYHRGTYTTQARIKRENRKCELLLRDAEMWAALSDLEAYPKEQLEAAWKKVLLNQFHDIIPGSSIHWVYQDAERAYVEVREACEAIINESLGRIVDRINTVELESPVVLFNSLSHARTEPVAIPQEVSKGKSTVKGPSGFVPIQPLEDGSSLILASAPPLGFAVYDLIEAKTEDWTGSKVGDRFIENDLLRVEWDDDGMITSIFDKGEDRQVIAEGARANVFQIHPDYPVNWDAWDLDPFYSETVTDLNQIDDMRIVERGPVRAAVEFTRTFGSSRISQRMSLASGSRRVEFHTTVDWHEDHKVLKVAFPVDVRSHRATYEIQFGHVERPTHENTSWDTARFEVCGHKWVDISEAGYGVALLNDCKYGHDIQRNVIRLTLLRAPTYPDPVADRGPHEFAYALLPHPGDFRQAGVIAEAYSFNVPLRVFPTDSHGGMTTNSASFFSIDGDGVVLETIKKLEDRPGIAVRLYEAFGGRAKARIESPEFRAAAHIDLLEREIRKLPPEDTLDIGLRPFELATFEFRTADQ